MIIPSFIGIARAKPSASALWTPTQLGASLYAWYDASDASTITLNGSSVSQWQDKSGNSRHASQATGSIQPLYLATGFNGLPTLSFNGTNQNLTTTYTLNYPLSMVVAVQNTETSSIVRSAIGSGNLSYSLGLLTATPSHRAFSFWNPNLNRGVYINNTQSTSPVILSASANSDNELTWTLYVNGSNTGSVNESTGGNVSPTTLRIGYSGSASEYWRGNISEVVLTTNVISNSDRLRLEGYLAHKWGTTASLPSDHPYKTNPPTL